MLAYNKHVWVYIYFHYYFVSKAKLFLVFELFYFPWCIGMRKSDKVGFYSVKRGEKLQQKQKFFHRQIKFKPNIQKEYSLNEFKKLYFQNSMYLI